MSNFFDAVCRPDQRGKFHPMADVVNAFVDDCNRIDDARNKWLREMRAGGPITVPQPLYTAEAAWRQVERDEWLQEMYGHENLPSSVRLPICYCAGTICGYEVLLVFEFLKPYFDDNTVNAEDLDLYVRSRVNELTAPVRYPDNDYELPFQVPVEYVEQPMLNKHPENYRYLPSCRMHVTRCYYHTNILEREVQSIFEFLQPRFDDHTIDEKSLRLYVVSRVDNFKESHKLGIDHYSNVVKP